MEIKKQREYAPVSGKYDLPIGMKVQVWYGGGWSDGTVDRSRARNFDPHMSAYQVQVSLPLSSDFVLASPVALRLPIPDRTFKVGDKVDGKTPTGLGFSGWSIQLVDNGESVLLMEADGWEPLVYRVTDGKDFIWCWPSSLTTSKPVWTPKFKVGDRVSGKNCCGTAFDDAAEVRNVDTSAECLHHRLGAPERALVYNVMGRGWCRECDLVPYVAAPQVPEPIPVDPPVIKVGDVVTVTSGRQTPPFSAANARIVLIQTIDDTVVYLASFKEGDEEGWVAFDELDLITIVRKGGAK